MSHFKPTSPQTIAGIKDVPTYEAMRQLRDAINSVLGVLGKEYTITTPTAADTDFTLIHNLGRVVDSYLVTYKSAACDIYIGSIAANENTLTLRSTVGNVSIKLVLL